MSVADYLGRGAENAISAATLAAVTHTTPRELRRIVMDERKRGALILYQPGGRGGYFLPSRDEEQAQREVAEFYHTQAARCRNGFAAIAPAGRFLKIPAGQLKINTTKGKQENEKEPIHSTTDQ